MESEMYASIRDGSGQTLWTGKARSLDDALARSGFVNHHFAWLRTIDEALDAEAKQGVEASLIQVRLAPNQLFDAADTLDDFMIFSIVELSDD
ncbi:MAG TPA: hypothetical protein VIR56_16055 [Solimonas sp.]